MRKVVTRALVAGALGAVALGLDGGVASADDGPAVWVLPGVDAGALLGPTVGLPTGALAPVDGLLTYLAG
ncbi:MAG TPA: hypothetical protein VHC18_08950 [Amycolatopsis sp.]|nr:hypothetical protein [Amycolatopsis sp.]